MKKDFECKDERERKGESERERERERAKGSERGRERERSDKRVKREHSRESLWGQRERTKNTKERTTRTEVTTQARSLLRPPSPVKARTASAKEKHAASKAKTVPGSGALLSVPKRADGSHSHGTKRASRPPEDLDLAHDVRSLKQKRQEKEGGTSYDLSPQAERLDFDNSENMHVKPHSKVTWSDHHGKPLCTFPSPAEIPLPRHPEKRWYRDHGLGAKAGPRTYKETLLHQPSFSKRVEHSRSPAPRRPLRFNHRHRCYKCLASDHLLRDCRDPLLCTVCFCTGHRARQCPTRRTPATAKMQSARDFRPEMLKVFIPLSEDFHRHQTQRRCAVLADVISRSNLGHCPQAMIAMDLAAKFGGFTSDFLVARHPERDFVVFLLEWVSPDELINRGLSHLAHCRLRCFYWDPYRNVDPSRIAYKAWIKILNLPFECWTANRVSTIVSGFGRFLKADDSTSNLMDLAGYRCSVAVDDLAAIPEYLAISMGDHVIHAPVRIESTAPFGGDDRGIPFAGGDADEGGDQTDPQGRQLARRVFNLGLAGGDSDSREGNRSEQSPTWNSSEIRDRRRDFPLLRRTAELSIQEPAVLGAEATSSGGTRDGPPVDCLLRLDRCPQTPPDHALLLPSAPQGHQRLPGQAPYLGKRARPLSGKFSNFESGGGSSSSVHFAGLGVDVGVESVGAPPTPSSKTDVF